MRDEQGRRRRVPAWLRFTVLRVLAFLVPLALAYVLGANLVFAAIIAAIVGLCVSIIFLSGQRHAFSGELASIRVRPARNAEPEPGEDELVEDAAVDAASDQDGPAQNGNTKAAASPRP